MTDAERNESEREKWERFAAVLDIPEADRFETIWHAWSHYFGSDLGSFYGRKRLRDRILAALDSRDRRIAELEWLLKYAGVAEIGARNPNVMSYMREWEERAEKAEAERDAAQQEIASMQSLPAYRCGHSDGISDATMYLSKASDRMQKRGDESEEDYASVFYFGRDLADEWSSQITAHHPDAVKQENAEAVVSERDDWKAKALAANAEAFEASAERDAVAFEIRDYRYMDPPDGGDPSLAEMVGRLWKDMEAKKAERDALCVQLAAAQADTERLDWLQEQGDGVRMCYLPPAAETLRGVIDAARATKESK